MILAETFNRILISDISYADHQTSSAIIVWVVVQNNQANWQFLSTMDNKLIQVAATADLQATCFMISLVNAMWICQKVMIMTIIPYSLFSFCFFFHILMSNL